MSETDTSCAIGLDVGGTKIAAGIVTFPSGTVHTKTTIPTHPQKGGGSVLEKVRGIAQSLIDISSRKNMHPVGIGIGVAELVDLEGNVTSGHTINWVDVPVQAILEELSPTTVDADVRVAALGEARYGKGVEHESFVYVSVGTGIGSTLVQNGLPYGGARGNALIMGSSPLSTICTDCGSQLHPVLEEYSSGPAIVRRYTASGGKADKAQDVFRAALLNDQSAIDVLVSAADSLGVSVAFLVNVLDPHAVIVGGGLGSARGIYFDRFVTSTRRHIWSTTNRNLPILQSHLGADAGMVGAATRAYLEFA